jgi:hypothetical protein
MAPGLAVPEEMAYLNDLEDELYSVDVDDDDNEELVDEDKELDELDKLDEEDDDNDEDDDDETEIMSSSSRWSPSASASITLSKYGVAGGAIHPSKLKFYSNIDLVYVNFYRCSEGQTLFTCFTHFICPFA